MKYEDMVRQNHLLDDYKYKILNVTLNQNTCSIVITYQVDRVLKVNDYIRLNEDTSSFLAKFGSKDTSIILQYQNRTITTEDAFEYLSLVIDRVAKRDFAAKCLHELEKSFDGNDISFIIDNDSQFLNRYAPILSNELKKSYLNINVKFVVSDKMKTLSQMKNEEDQRLINEAKQLQEIEKTVQKRREEINTKPHYRRKMSVNNLSKIKEIPFNQDGIFTYQEQIGLPNFLVQGEIFTISIEKKKISYLLRMHIFDETDGIIVNKWVSESELETIGKLKKGDIVSVMGKAEYNNYQHSVVLQAAEITFVTSNLKEKIHDDALVKRVELNIHTKMSNLDGLNDASEFLSMGEEWGMEAMAFTDHAGVYEIPDVTHSIGKKKIKPIFGVELPFIDDLSYRITFSDEHIDLKDATYVVFDLETTGFSQEYDRIIEIAAIKIEHGIISSKYETFVNPEMEISEQITELTTITNDMVKNERTIAEVIDEFLAFIGDSILVAHNASFDIGMLLANCRRLNKNIRYFKAIDTLNLFRAMCNKDELPDKGVAKFNLKVLSKFYKIKQEQHHRAIDDTRVTAECFLQMLQDLYKKNVFNYKDINSVINPNNFYRYVIPSSIHILCKTEKGLRNMYRLLSDALTVHCFGEGRLLKSVLETYRADNLVTSGGYLGDVFENALNKSEEDTIKAIRYVDIVEVQPPSGYLHLIDGHADGRKRIEETIKKIIRLSKQEGKIVVATSAAHYIDKNDKKYRDILIASPQIGGGQHDLARYSVAPDAHLRTTNEMLEEFAFLDKDLAYEIVVTNTRLVADLIERYEPFHKEMFAPRDDQFKDSLNVPSIVEEMKKIVYENLEKYYGTKIHPIIQKRLDKEMNSIISNGYSSTYYMAHLLVKKSMDDGYMVGSRGSVGSSLVATMMNITEINPLPPHYRCKNCKFVAFKMTDAEKKEYGVSKEEEGLQESLAKVESGYDLDDAICPVCGKPLSKDGHEIPFETFLGFKGDKVPDIDLNFSGEYQSRAHAFIKDVFGATHAFRGGTISTVADKNAYGYVKAFLEKKKIQIRDCEIDRIASKIVGVKRSSGQHPGGIVVVPNYVDIFEVTPVQYPADNIENEWITTHYDYHSFEDNLLKLDCLGHDDPTLIRYFMDYVNAHQEDYPFTNPEDIPVDDKNVYKMFCQTQILNVTEEQIMSKVASYAVPEFGTNFVRNMLNDTLPQTFAQLVKISGLSHGTNVWNTNAQDLVLGKTEFGEIPFADVIGCRDDIMIDMINMGCDPLKSFSIMEFVRKGKAKKDPTKWKEYMDYMRESKVPDWYIWSCDRIEYLFPKAHATAYVLMALRIAWFKLYSPALFYSGWFSKRAKAFDVNAFLKGPEFIRQEIQALAVKTNKTAKDDDLMTALNVALEMTERGLKFLPVDIEKSDALIFEVVDKKSIRIPFVAVDGLGESAALSIKAARNERPFSSKDDVVKRTKLNKSLFEQFEKMHALGDLPEKDKIEEEGLFALLD